MTISVFATLGATPELMERRSGGKSIAAEMGAQNSVDLSLEKAAEYDFPEHSFIVVHCIDFDDEVAAKIDAIRRPARSWLVVRFEQLQNAGGLTWFADRGAVPLSRDVSNGLTVLNCYRAIVDGTLGPAQPPRQADTALSDLLYARRSEGSPDRSNIVFGVLSLPRSGSKSLADRLVLWGSPNVRVFHSHDLTDERGPKFERQLHQARQTNDAALERSARMKLDGHRSLLAKLAAAEKTVLFLIERDPVDRIYSSIGLARQKELLAWSEGKIGDADMAEMVRADTRKRVRVVEGWYDAQYRPRGVRPEDIVIPQGGCQVVHASQTLSVVIVRIQDMKRLFSDAGVDSPLVSSNTAQERGYGELVTRMRQAFPFPQSETESLLRHPWLSRIHYADAV